MLRVAMGDISAEPSMEEILSSIKRIIAEEGEGTPTRARRPQRTAVPVDRDEDADEVLELRQPMPVAERIPERVAPPPPAPQPVQRAPEPQPQPAPRAPEPQPAMPTPEAVEPIVSRAAAAASRGALDQLSRMIVQPQAAGGDNTLEGLVREMLRPMLRDWLDAHLPQIVETMVAREIERISGSPQG